MKKIIWIFIFPLLYILLLIPFWIEFILRLPTIEDKNILTMGNDFLSNRIMDKTMDKLCG